MSRHAGVWLALLALISGGAKPQADGDRIRASLDRAIERYRTSMTAIEADVLKELDRLDDAARKARQLDRDRIERIRAERQAFIDWGDVPPDASRKTRDRIARARDAIVKEFASASDAYVRARQDEAARKLDQEFRMLLKLARPAEPGSTAIFNEKDLSGWRIVNGDGAYAVDRGQLVCTATGGRLQTERSFSDYVLKLEYLFPEDADREHGSGIVLFGERSGNNVVGLDGKGALLYQILPGQSGTLRVLAGNRGENPRRERRDVPERPAGMWNEVEIRSRGADLTFLLNGQVVNEARLEWPVPTFVALGTGTPGVRFRNLRVISATSP